DAVPPPGARYLSIRGQEQYGISRTGAESGAGGLHHGLSLRGLRLGDRRNHVVLPDAEMTFEAGAGADGEGVGVEVARDAGGGAHQGRPAHGDAVLGFHLSADDELAAIDAVGDDLPLLFDDDGA